MYSAVLMVVMSSGTEAPDLGRRRGRDGCCGCYGAPVYNMGCSGPSIYYGGDQGQPVPTTRPRMSQQNGGVPATLVVSVPADARLTINGDATNSTSEMRVFISPPLEPGQYTYRLQATALREGRPVTVEREVQVTPGMESHVSLAFNTNGGGFEEAEPQAVQQNGVKTRSNIYINGYSATPWFTQPAIRKQLRLTDEQLNRMNKAYGQTWTTYQSGWNNLSKLSDEERTRRQQELNAAFQRDINQLRKDILEPEQQTRFDQLYWQYRGYDSFQDPVVRDKLKLTDEQVQKLNKFSTSYHTDMQRIYDDYSRDATKAAPSYTKIRRQMDDQIRSVLDENQRRTWESMVGEPYQFTPVVPPTTTRQKS